MNTIDRTALLARLKSTKGPLLLEALPEKYFRHGHLPGAWHFYPDRAEALGPLLPRDRDAEIVVYCASDTCKNSAVAAEALMVLGYRNVRVYAGGKKDWVDAGLPLERERDYEGGEDNERASA